MEPSRDGRKSICVDLGTESQYAHLVATPERFRSALDACFARWPELFPKDFAFGYRLHGAYCCRRVGVTIRRIKLRSTGQVFQVRPSFLMPYAVARVDEIEKGLYLRLWGVSFSGIASVLGRNETFWYRAFLALGRPSLVGALVHSTDALPKDVVADEKHTWIGGAKAYVAVTATGGVVLGAELVDSRQAASLADGYRTFVNEARDIERTYEPETVCLDGYESSWQAWTRVCPGTTLVLCFLHSVLKMILRCPKDRELRRLLVDRLWHVYAAERRAAFSQRLRRLREWGEGNLPDDRVRETLVRICSKGPRLVAGYVSEAGHRTTNGVDRVMDYLDRVLYAMRYLHGTRERGRLAIRAQAALWNFHPYGARTRRADPSRRSPFHDFTGFEYHANWLQNFLIASSMAGRRL
jgi:hypothetical protein